VQLGALIILLLIKLRGKIINPCNQKKHFIRSFPIVASIIIPSRLQNRSKPCHLLSSLGSKFMQPVEFLS
jgi:hypothetical protein